MVALLRRLEWGCDGLAYCPSCHSSEESGHADDCELKLAIVWFSEYADKTRTWPWEVRGEPFPPPKG